MHTQDAIARHVNVHEKHMSDGPSMRSMALSRTKKMLDMADGDEHFVSNLRVGPINDMYLAIRAYSMFPHGMGKPALIHDTKAK